MPTFNIQDYGILGGVLVLLIIMFYKAPEIVTAVKGQSRTTTTEVSNSNGVTSNNLVLQELTVAISKLTGFLEMEKAVDKEKDQVLSKNLDTILSGVDELKRVQADHVLKCELNCKRSNN